MNTTHAKDKSPASELREIAQAIEEHRLAEKLSKTKLQQLYPDLGSDKTYNLCLAGTTSELDCEKWLAQYRHVALEIAAGDDQVKPITLCNKLTGPSELCRAVLSIQREQTNARVIILVGGSGVGKTSSIEVLKSKVYGWRVLDVEASTAWRSPRGTGRPLLKAIARALGITNFPRAKDDLENEVIVKLCAARRILVIDEFHHLDPDGLNQVKRLVNATPGEFILSGLRTAWQRLTSSKEAWEECKQLTGNRLAECIELTLTEADVRLYLDDQLGELPGYTDELARRATNELGGHAHLWGNYAFLRDVCRRITKAVTKGGQKLAPIVVSTALNAELKSRGGQAAKSVRVIARENTETDSEAA